MWCIAKKQDLAQMLQSPFLQHPNSYISFPSIEMNCIITYLPKRALFVRPIYFFDIPIYRLSPEKYSIELNRYLTKKLSSPDMSTFLKSNPKIALQNEEFFTQQFGGMWEYNEIIGYIKLYILGSQIRGEYSLVKAKRITRTRNKQFKYLSDKIEPELELPIFDSNDVIYSRILDYINNCKKKLNNRFVDTSLFEIVGPHIDWSTLIKT